MAGLPTLKFLKFESEKRFHYKFVFLYYFTHVFKHLVYLVFWEPNIFLTILPLQLNLKIFQFTGDAKGESFLHSFMNMMKTVEFK